jgi:hypothetical protein
MVLLLQRRILTQIFQSINLPDRHSNLVLNSTRLIKRVHQEAVTWIDLDLVEKRWE